MGISGCRNSSMTFTCGWIPIPWDTDSGSTSACATNGSALSNCTSTGLGNSFRCFKEGCDRLWEAVREEIDGRLEAIGYFIIISETKTKMEYTGRIKKALYLVLLILFSIATTRCLLLQAFLTPIPIWTNRWPSISPWSNVGKTLSFRLQLYVDHRVVWTCLW